MANTIAVNIVGDVKDINNKLGNVEKQLAGFGKSIGKVGGLLKGAFAFAAGAAVVGQIGDMVTAASDMNETLSKSQTIFGSASKDIEAFGNNAAKSLGLSKQEAIAGAASFGNFFDQIGIGKKASADMSKSFLKMSADLASFNNADPSQVMESFISATRGEYDSLQAFIPTVNAAKVETEALRLSHKKSAKDLTDADKASALYSLSVKGMGKAQGDFAKTSTGAANQQRILTAKWKDAQATIGTALLPIMTKLLNFITSKGIPAVQKFADQFSKNFLPTLKEVGKVLGEVGGFIADHAKTFGVLAGVVATVAVATKAYTVAMAAQNAIMAAGGIAKYLASLNVVKLATAAWTAVQWLLNVAMTANPIGLLIVGIGLLVAAVVILIKKNEGVRKALLAAWDAIKKGVSAAVGFVVNFVKKNWPLLLAIITGPIGLAVALIIKYWSNIKAAFSKGVAAVKSAANSGFGAVRNIIEGAWKKVVSAVSTAISGITSLARGIKGKVTGALSGAGSWLVQIGKNIIQGLINGISSMAGNVIGKARDLANSVKNTIGNALKIGSPSRLMIQFGKWVGEGLSIGIKNSTTLVKSASDRLSTAVIRGYGTPKLPTLVAGTASARGGAVNNYLTVQAPVGSSPALIGKELLTYLQAHSDVYGKRQMRNLV